MEECIVVEGALIELVTIASHHHPISERPLWFGPFLLVIWFGSRRDQGDLLIHFHLGSSY